MSLVVNEFCVCMLLQYLCMIREAQSRRRWGGDDNSNVCYRDVVLWSVCVHCPLFLVHCLLATPSKYPCRRSKNDQITRTGKYLSWFLQVTIHFWCVRIRIWKLLYPRYNQVVGHKLAVWKGYSGYGQELLYYNPTTPWCCTEPKETIPCCKYM